MRAGQSAVGTRLDRLQRPAVAIGIAEIDEPARRLHRDLARLDARCEQLLTRSLGVGDHHLDLLRAGRLVGDAVADHDRAGRAGWCQLNETQAVVHPVVMVSVEAHTLVEGLGPVDIGHWNGDELDLPIHAPTVGGGYDIPRSDRRRPGGPCAAEIDFTSAGTGRGNRDDQNERMDDSRTAFAQLDQITPELRAMLTSALDRMAADPQIRRVRRVAWQALAPRPGQRILDAGCGLGEVARELAAAVAPDGEVVALDLSAATVQAAAQRHDGSPVRYLTGDVAALGFPDRRSTPSDPNAYCSTWPNPTPR